MSHERDGRRGGGHKDLQVCRQVFDALSLALAEIDDPLIEQLALISVDPAPNAGRVLVTFAAPDGADTDAALERIRELAPELREEVAAEVHRRRAPELTFRIAPPAPVAPVGA
jgi:ribosome-binding factor A